MKGHVVTQQVLEEFRCALQAAEKSKNTVEKYIRDARAFAAFCGDTGITRENVIAYKQHLIDSNYAVRSINSMLASINSLFLYLGWDELRIKPLKVQQQVFCSDEKELTRKEYERLCRTAKRKHNIRLNLILQTICGTGIRVSELPFITAEAARKGVATVSLKGKTRTIILTNSLQRKLLRYIAEQKILTGPIFLTKTGRPISRTSIWREMKNLCIEAEVDSEKVYPHNLRHLFARVFYGLEKDIVKLADILGHSNVNTTRIYIVSTGAEHRRCMERMRLIL